MTSSGEDFEGGSLRNQDRTGKKNYGVRVPA